MADYGNDIYETGVVLEPIRPPVQNEPEYYDDDEYNYSVQDYNDIPLTPPTPQPAQRRPQVSGLDFLSNDKKHTCIYSRRTVLL